MHAEKNSATFSSPLKLKKERNKVLLANYQWCPLTSPDTTQQFLLLFLYVWSTSVITSLCVQGNILRRLEATKVWQKSWLCFKYYVDYRRQNKFYFVNTINNCYIFTFALRFFILTVSSLSHKSVSSFYLSDTKTHTLFLKMFGFPAGKTHTRYSGFQKKSADRGQGSYCRLLTKETERFFCTVNNHL